MAAAFHLIRIHVRAGTRSHEDDSLQFFGIRESISERDSPIHTVAAEDDIFVPAGSDESAHPLKVTVDIVAGCAGGVSGKIDCLGVSEMPELVVVGETGATSPCRKTSFI